MLQLRWPIVYYDRYKAKWVWLNNCGGVALLLASVLSTKYKLTYCTSSLMDKNTEAKNKASRWQIFRKSHNSTGHGDDIQRKRSPSFPSRPHKATTISTIPKTTTQPIGLCVPNGEIIGQDRGTGSRIENSINTQLVIAETERDQYKKEMEKRDREYQNEIVQLKVEMKKRAFSQMPMTINDRKGEDEVDVLKKRLKMIEEEKEAAEAQLRETIDSLQHQLNEFKLKNSRESEIFQQKQHLVTQIAKYKLKDQKQQEELREKEKQIMELNEKLSKRNVNIADLNEKLTELINENYISAMNNEKPNVVRAESDQDSAKQEVTEAYNEIQRQTDKISQLNEEIETLKQEHVEEKENLLTAINEQSNIIKRSEVDFNMMAREMDHKETELQELYDNLKKKCQTIDTLTEKVADMYKTESALRAAKDDKQIALEELTLKLQATEIKLQQKNSPTEKIADYMRKFESLNEMNQRLTNELSDKDIAFKEMEVTLSRQIDTRAGQVDELNNTLSEVQDKCKLLEDQLMKKNEEVEKLKQELQNECSNKEHFISAFNQEKGKVTALEQDRTKLEEELIQERQQLADESEAHLILNQQLQERITELSKELNTIELTADSNLTRVKKLHQQEAPWKVDRNEIDITKQELGRGGWAVVNVANFRGTLVAAKHLHQIVISEFNISLFIREINIAATIRHPNLVQFIGATLVDNPIILSELMSTSLRKELEKNRLTQTQIIKISSDICRGLNYLHLFQPSPIVHRDVSDANVLLEPSGGAGEWKAKLSDYGSANLIHNISPSSVIPGCIAYAAPEAEFPNHHSPAMDVYSLGVLVMVMILHSPPSPTVDERETQSNTIVWPSMKSLVQQCINYHRYKRPSTGCILIKLEDQIHV